MSLSLRTFLLAAATVAGAAVASLSTGCQSAPPPQYADVQPGAWTDSAGDTPTGEPTPAQPPQTQGGEAATVGEPGPAQGVGRADVFRVDDVVTVSVGGIAAEVIKDHEERIKEDGSITLYLVGKVQAAGKTAGELQTELQEKYEVYYRNPVVTVKSFQRVYYVGGEVKRPGPQVYLGETTVTKAIQAAGDFTDFAQKRSIRVIRADGTTVTVNFGKLLDDPHLDPPIYPGDKIHVPRRIFF
jgi:polysaccharide export outer membrane protein